MSNLQAGETTSPSTFLAQKVGMNKDSLDHIVQGKTETIDFNMADRLITHSVGPSAWYAYPELKKIYFEADLSDKGVPPGHAKCRRRGCENVFEISQYGRYPKRYCSRNCKNYTNTVTSRRKAGVKDHTKWCKNGHKRTRHNTRYVKAGYRRCMTCKRIADRKYFRKDSDGSR